MIHRQQEPGHVLPDSFRVLDSFLILFNIANLPTDPDDGKTGNEHVICEEEMKQRVDGQAGSGASHGNNGIPYRTAEWMAVGIRNKTCPINKCLHLRGEIQEIHRGSENEPICLSHRIDTGIDDIIIDDAVPVPVLEALHAGSTAVDLLPANLHDFCLDPFLLKFRKDMPDQKGGISLIPWTHFECNDVCHLISQ